MPEWNDLTKVYGKLTSLQVEQVNSRDQIWCWLEPENGSEVESYFTFRTYAKALDREGGEPRSARNSAR